MLTTANALHRYDACWRWASSGSRHRATSVSSYNTPTYTSTGLAQAKPSAAPSIRKRTEWAGGSAQRSTSHGRSWLSTEGRKKREPSPPGQMADLAVLTADYFSIPERQIKHLDQGLPSWVERSFTPAKNSQNSRRLRCCEPKLVPVKNMRLREGPGPLC